MNMNPQDPQYGSQYPPQQPQYPPQQPQYPPQPGYGAPPQAPYGAPVPPPTVNRWGPSSIGMDANVAAGLSYITIVGIIFFFIEKTNRFVKFHAAQSILLGIVAFALGIVQNIIDAVLFSASTVTYNATNGATTGGSVVGATLLGCVFGLVYLGLFGLWLWGIISAFTGKYTKLPVIGDIAERWAGGPPMGA
jgi:uncharacterized membrane protein